MLVRLFPKSKCAFVTFKNPQQALSSLKLEGSAVGLDTQCWQGLALSLLVVM